MHIGVGDEVHSSDWWMLGAGQSRRGHRLDVDLGRPARHLALQGALQAMTGKEVYMGPQPERAAAFKLFGNLTLLGLLGILGDVGRLAAAVGIDMKDAFSLFEHFNPARRCRRALSASAPGSTARRRSRCRWRVRGMTTSSTLCKEAEANSKGVLALRVVGQRV
jgi:3-hydroxyisobutyrate dehydrogenase-like beta-hydroxyacid dehydrogenase